MTNLDGVRAMSGSELKKWFCQGRKCEECPYKRTKFAIGTCGFFDWLFSRAEPRQAEEKFKDDGSIEELQLKPSTFAALWEAEVKTLRQLYALRFYDLARIPGVGEVRAWEIRERAEGFTGRAMRP